MDGALKELDRVEKLASNASLKGKSPSINDSLDSLLQSLREVKGRLHAGTATAETFSVLAKTVDSRKKDVDERQKEVYNSLGKVGKALDKKFLIPLPSYDPLFVSAEATGALDRTIALHFLRTGQFHTAEAFIETILQEADVNIDPKLHSHFVDLHHIMSALREQNVQPALEWANRNREFLTSRSSPLEFLLVKSQYIHLLLGSQPPDIRSAIAYARRYFPSFSSQHAHEISRLMTCVLFLSHLSASPYSEYASSDQHSELGSMFAKEFCASLGMSRQVPLRAVGDIGGGGALARIEKGRKIMRERKSEWSRTDELPIEIPLPPENRYHSIFACPVSKEQSTESNPPMMMGCGHVITKDSLQKLSKPGGRVKCPYCPVESQISAALRVHF
ncbi:hypothetical protein WOLCODRAFT_136130 [Wolfiporia cocos MD-104 SS10]|uniref:GID complex catalytic subunit 2 n=1 Tax=Wolfiporia cocos (strain MD-104) TaxID=742152 RepID=A0A2H3JHK5_WOLCO|nr:hypothetical protein WOLCODRAFT_136130 [Wolfiporia cocos MD-104 SS10]